MMPLRGNYMPYLRLICAVLLAMICAAPQVTAGELYELGLRDIPIAANERVIGFEINLVGARIHSLGEIPIDWGIQVQNDSNWRTRVSGGCQHGAGSLEPAFFDKWLSIEKADTRPNGPDFSMTVELIVMAIPEADDRVITVPARSISLLPR
jgi:hypothetical protein